MNTNEIDLGELVNPEVVERTEELDPVLQFGNLGHYEYRKIEFFITLSRYIERCLGDYVKWYNEVTSDDVEDGWGNHFHIQAIAQVLLSNSKDAHLQNNLFRSHEIYEGRGGLGVGGVEDL